MGSDMPRLLHTTASVRHCLAERRSSCMRRWSLRFQQPLEELHPTRQHNKSLLRLLPDLYLSRYIRDLSTYS
jgi:hypothetical protein